MAWNQPGGGKEPWKPRGGGNPVDDFLGRLKSQLGIGNAGNRPSWVKPVLFVLALLLLFNCFKLIDESERGVVLRFGKFDRILTPGPNFKLPWPMETVSVVKTTQVRELKETVKVLTKDENVVEIEFNVQYSISDPKLFLFGFRDDVNSAGSTQGMETMREAAESAVREVIGNNTMDSALFERNQLAITAKQLLQDSLSLYRTGITVSQLSLPNARPPNEVKNAFDEATSAREMKNSIVNEARAYASKVVPEARGTASRIKAEADGYRQASVAKATGDASRFRQLADEYRKSPEVTRKRLYLETMQDVMTRNPKIVSGKGNIFYLPAPGSAAPAPNADGVSRPSPAVVTPPVPPADSSGRGEVRQGREGT